MHGGVEGEISMLSSSQDTRGWGSKFGSSVGRSNCPMGPSSRLEISAARGRRERWTRGSKSIERFKKKRGKGGRFSMSNVAWKRRECLTRENSTSEWSVKTANQTKRSRCYLNKKQLIKKKNIISLEWLGKFKDLAPPN